MITFSIVKVLIPVATAFTVGIGITPIITHYLYKYKAWKKQPHKVALDGNTAEEFSKLREHTETKTPRMGGIIIWLSVCITTGLYYLLALVTDVPLFDKLDYLSRDQTWIPLMTLLLGSLVGLLNDIRDISPDGERGLSILHRLTVVTAVGAGIAWWFYAKLDVMTVGLPYFSDITLGAFIIPLFVLVMIALYASGVIDGIDGLSGGVFASIFAAYAIIAFSQSQLNLAAFSGAMLGATLAFLWFNIPPARFWMTETGTMGITMTIAVLAFMTDALGGGEGIALLPIIGFLLVITVLSNILQVCSKRFRGKKLFKVAPIHHHFEAIGWPSYKVTMRYWILSVLFAFVGVIIALTG